MKKVLAVLITAALASGLALIAVAAPASAHTPNVTATCSTLSVKLSSYQTNGSNTSPNTVKVTVQGAVVADTTFGTSFDQTYALPTTNTTHTYQVDVTAWDTSRQNNYDVHTGVVEVAPCAVAVTPTAPSFTPASCNTPGTLVIPNQNGVVYTVSQSGHVKTAPFAPGSYTVDAAPASNAYTLTGTKHWVINVPAATTGTPCVVTPVAPTVTQITACNTDGSIVLPTTDHVNYVLSEGDGKTGAYTVTATPASGYTFVGDQTVTFRGNLGNHITCATPVAPTVVASSACDVPGSVTPAETTGVSYSFAAGSSDMTSGDYDIVATPTTGYAFVGAQSVHFTGTLAAATDCITVGTAPTAKNITCVLDDEADTATKVGGYIEVKPVAGVTYTITGTPTGGTAITPIVIASTGTTPIDTKLAPGSYTVTAAGDNLTGTTSWPLTIVDNAGLCIPTLPFTSGSVAADPQTCVNGKTVSGDITVALDPDTLSYTLNGVTLGAKTAVAPGTYTVQMVPAAGFTIDKTSATVTVGGSTAPCGDLATLAFTGGSLVGPGYLAAAALLLLAGGLFMQRSRRQKAQD